MIPTWISECLSRIRGARVGVFGDFRIDARWELDAGDVGASPRRVTDQRYTLGGAGNIAANLATLAANAVHAVGLIGDDLFGRHALDLMREAGIRADGVLRAQRDWQTAARGRALLAGRQVERFEYGSFNRVAETTLDRLADALDRTAAWCDVVVLHQDLDAGIATPEMIGRINRVISRHARCRFLVDAQRHADIYRGAMVKLTADHAVRLCGLPLDEHASDAARRCATQLHHRIGQPIFVTQGERGVMVSDAAGMHESPSPPLDVPCSAENIEETTTAGLASILAGGGTPVLAIRFANLAARITAPRLDGPATATPEQIRESARVDRAP